MTRKILDFYASVETVTTQLVKMIVSIFTFSIGEIAPLAAPIAPAFSVFKALSERLETPFAIALAGAIAIELVGIFISKTAIHCHNWNSTRTKTEPVAAKALAISMAAIFFSVVLILSLTIEIDPRLAILVYPGFVLIAITTYTALAVSNNLTVWERERAERHAQQAERSGLAADIRQAKTEAAELTETVQKLRSERVQLDDDIKVHKARLKRVLAAQEADKPPNDTSIKDRLPQANATRQAQIDDRHQAIIEIKTNEPGITQPDLTSRLNEIGYQVSLSTVKRDIKQLNGSVLGVK